MSVRTLVKRLVTKNDYYHRPHSCDPNPSDPADSYYYDLRARESFPGEFRNGLPLADYRGLIYVNPVNAAQYGLASLQLYWDTGNDEFLVRAASTGRAIIDEGRKEGRSLVWRYPIPLCGEVNWLSSMAQGQIASLLRLGILVGEDAFLECGREALVPLLREVREGGVMCYLGNHIWLEEYATTHLRYTLNGFIVSLLGLRDAAILLSDSTCRQMYDACIETLTTNLARFDMGNWSLYDLRSRHVGFFEVKNVASPFYHAFHIELLKVLEKLTGLDVFRGFRLKWEEGLHEGFRLYSAVFEKTLYRVTDNLG